MNNNLFQLFSIVANHSKNTYLVGGCVRDSILGVEANDYDMVTDTPMSTLSPELLSNGWKISGVGEAFLVYVLSKNGEQYELANFRKDGINSKSLPSIGTLEEDAARRDFTCNALYENPFTKTIFDPNDTGLDDIRSRTLRFIGNPHDRISEDSLRVFRFYRFLAQLGFVADKKSLAACREMFNDAYKKTTPERVRMELERMSVI